MPVENIQHRNNQHRKQEVPSIYGAVEVGNQRKNAFPAAGSDPEIQEKGKRRQAAQSKAQQLEQGFPFQLLCQNKRQANQRIISP